MAKYIVTSALPYINGVKHLGNLVGSLLPADVYARYLRLLGEDVLCVCGTDEHGTPAQISAMEEGVGVKDYVDKYYKIQKKIYEDFGLSFDYFGRTSSPENHKITQHLFLKLKENGLIEERETTQYYSEDDKMFLSDRFIVGTCPNCGYESARGDQCEQCAKLLDPTDLKNPRSAISGGANLALRTSKHLFLNLPKMQGKISEWVATKSHWPKTSMSIARKWLKEGLKERSITRDLVWGIKVPLAGYEDKVFYVWFDAPIGYIGISMEWANKTGRPDRWKDYWKDPGTRLFQFMAKDNIPFHTVTWPATMMGADDGFVLADMVKGFQWLNFEGGKFSTSKGRGVFTDDALKLFPPDYWRYYLLYIIPEKADTDFKWRGFQTAVNKDLSDVLGNFVHRSLTFLNRYFDGVVPEVGKWGAEDDRFKEEFRKALAGIKSNMAACRFRPSVLALRDFWIECNKYFEVKAPWQARKDDIESAKATMNLCAHVCRGLAIAGSIFIPFTSQKIFAYLGLDEDPSKKKWDDILDFDCLTGKKISPSPEPLFTKVEDEQVKELSERFAGK